MNRERAKPSPGPPGCRCAAASPSISNGYLPLSDGDRRGGASDLGEPSSPQGPGLPRRGRFRADASSFSLRGERGRNQSGGGLGPPPEPRIAAARRLPDGYLPLPAPAGGEGEQLTRGGPSPSGPPGLPLRGRVPTESSSYRIATGATDLGEGLVLPRSPELPRRGRFPMDTSPCQPSPWKRGPGGGEGRPGRPAAKSGPQLVPAPIGGFRAPSVAPSHPGAPRVRGAVRCRGPGRAAGRKCPLRCPAGRSPPRCTSRCRRRGRPPAPRRSGR